VAAQFARAVIGLRDERGTAAWAGQRAEQDVRSPAEASNSLTSSDAEEASA
jgi:hypothetical protein